MMPHPNGIELCREFRSIRRFEDTFIFFLTAKSESYYQQAALDTGGDDYIEKIIGLRALTYKIGTVLREKFVIRKSIRELKIVNLLIKRKSHSVWVDGKEIILNPPEFEVLYFLAQNPNKDISAENLLKNLWGSDLYWVDTSIENYIKNLIDKFGHIQLLGHHHYRFDVT
jgi:two-component system alkaline phosphatase synthesis response regulator PhoP